MIFQIITNHTPLKQEIIREHFYGYFFIVFIITVITFISRNFPFFTWFIVFFKDKPKTETDEKSLFIPGRK